MNAARLLDKVQGCLVGAVIGDCLGAPVECKYWDGIPASAVTKHFEGYHKAAAVADESDEASDGQAMFKYTDDTAMARQVTMSMLDNHGAIDVQDLAQRFCNEHRQGSFTCICRPVLNQINKTQFYFKAPTLIFL